MLGAAPHRLHRRPHVVLALQQVPTGGLEPARVDLPGVVDALRPAPGAVFDDRAPGEVAVALDHRVGAPAFVRLVRIERRVDAAVHDPRPALARPLAEGVADQRVAGVDADADDVAGLDPAVVERLEALVDHDRIAPLAGGRGREHVQPAGGDDGYAEREVAGVDDEYAHGSLPGSCRRGRRRRATACPPPHRPGRRTRGEARHRPQPTSPAPPSARAAGRGGHDTPAAVDCRPSAHRRQPPAPPGAHVKKVRRGPQTVTAEAGTARSGGVRSREHRESGA